MTVRSCCAFMAATVDRDAERTLNRAAAVGLSLGCLAAVQEKELPWCSLRILVVDDDGETRRLLARSLETGGHVVRGAASCADARGALAEASWDAIVLDVMLPDGSGIDLCRTLRKEQTSIPILLLTA